MYFQKILPGKLFSNCNCSLACAVFPRTGEKLVRNLGKSNSAARIQSLNLLIAEHVQFPEIRNQFELLSLKLNKDSSMCCQCHEFRRFRLKLVLNLERP